MQSELRTLGVDVQIHLINEAGFDSESAMTLISETGTLPALQDTVEDGVWDSWGVTFRDVYILDDANILVGTYNLTTHSLSVDENYEELKAMFIAASGG